MWLEFCRVRIEYLRSLNTRGGIILAWRQDTFQVVGIHKGSWSVTVKIKMLRTDAEWFLTSVYGPQLDHEKYLFLDELLQIRSLVQGGWIVGGDFNLICVASDKNNNKR